jgi:alpha-beta hydrolase superfamily lysophospholipase
MSMSRDAAPVWWNPRRRSETLRGYSTRERGRHPTEARKVVPNPRRAAGSTVVLYWLRLFSCAKANKHHEDLKKLLPTLDVGSHSNARFQARRAAGARHERTLLAVACKPLLDLHPLLPPWFGFAFDRRSRRASDCVSGAMGRLPADGLHADD